MHNAALGSLRPPFWPGDHPLFQRLGLTVERVGDGEAVLTTDIPSRFANTSGGVHGGTYGALGACAAEVAVASSLDDAFAATIVDFRVQIFRPILPGDPARITACLQHLGRRYLAAGANVTNADGKVCASFTATFAVEPASPLIPPVGAVPPTLAPPRIHSEHAPAWTTWRTRIVESSEGFCRASSHFDPAFAGFDGAIHPAFIAAVADSAAGGACVTAAREGEAYTTLEYKANFIRPIAAGALWADATVAGRDHRAFAATVRVTDEAGSVAAVMLTSVAILRKDGLQT